MGELVIDQYISDQCALYHGDSCEIIKGIPSNSAGYSIFSPPFEDLYTYSNSERDLGNSRGSEMFARHFGFLLPEIYRILMPGRSVSIHCMDMPRSKARNGEMSIRDFGGELVRAAEETGFLLHSKVVIWKDPVTAMQRTKALGLLWKQIKKDSSLSRMGIPDYLVTLRKPGINPARIARPTFVGYHGTDAPDCDEGMWIATDEKGGRRRPEGYFTIRPDSLGKWPNRNPFSPGSEAFDSWGILVWQKYASPVWMDINPSDTLQRLSAREDHDERHICPLQLSVVRRGIELWSNPGEMVFTPFLGIGSEVVEALRAGRRGVGGELKASYFRQAVLNCQAAEQTNHQSVLCLDGAAA